MYCFRLDLTQMLSDEDDSDEGYVSKPLAVSLIASRFPNLNQATVAAWVDVFDTQKNDTVRYYHFIQCCSSLMAK